MKPRGRFVEGAQDCGFYLCLAIFLPLSLWSCGDKDLTAGNSAAERNTIAHVVAIAESLAYLGSDITENELKTLRKLDDSRLSVDADTEAQKILERFVLVEMGADPIASLQATLAEGGWSNYLIKISAPESAGCRISVSSQNSGPVVHKSKGGRYAFPDNVISDEKLRERFLELIFYQSPQIDTVLLNQKYQYFVLQMYTRANARQSAELDFSYHDCDIVPSSQRVSVTFDINPATKVKFLVKDHDGSSTTASFTITDGINRLVPNPEIDPLPLDYRHRHAVRPPWERLWTGNTAVVSPGPSSRNVGIYPLPARRVATRDNFPDLYFQAQIYRDDGEYVMLQPETYNVKFQRGPEYRIQKRQLIVTGDDMQQEEMFELERWTNLADKGWYSSDLHVHASGCKHHESPDNGLQPDHIWRQARGEDLSVVAVLNWGVGWYDHKKYFEQQRVQKFGSDRNIVRYDVEVSEFPSGQLGHLALLGLEDDDYPGTDKVEDWPSWTIPILRWAKNQGSVTGFLHTGWGMQPLNFTTALPNFEMPELSGIGANEYVVAITQDIVDLFGVGDTSPIQELNIWYHSLNSGFRPKIMGESDFPCVYHEKIGIARGYAKVETPLSFDNYLQQIEAGRSYVSDGLSHIIDFAANGIQMGVGDSELSIVKGDVVNISASVAAYLDEAQTPVQAFIAAGGDQRQPSWALEKSRIGNTRNVSVDLVVNGNVEASTVVAADGDWRNIQFSYTPEMSSWLALRVFPSSHTNPIFLMVDGQPIRPSAQSAEWMRQVVNRLWNVKSDNIRDSEKNEARVAYDDAVSIFQEISEEASHKR